jgi:hypothetical protein
MDVPITVEMIDTISNIPFDGNIKDSIRMVGLVAVRRIENQELFATYHQAVI